MTTYTLRTGSPDRTRTDVVVIGVAQSSSGALVPGPGGEAVAAAYGRRFAPLLTSMGFRGTPGETLRVPTADAFKAAQLLVVGLGPRDALTTEKVRRAAGVAARNLANASSVALALPAVDAEHIRAVADGFISGSYHYLKASGAEDAKPGPELSEVVILSEMARRQDSIAAFNAARLVGEVTWLARDWVNQPPNLLTPRLFADAVIASSKKVPGLRAEYFDTAELVRLGCGGILAVGLSSANPPGMVKLTWSPAGAARHVALVGKGITYDSGGLTIKPSGSMVTMKCDMAGAAAVAAATLAIARQQVPVAVTAWLPMAENSVSGSAMRPGDVLTMADGQTVEVLNTDAEGRLLLGDAFSLAVREAPDVLVNLATLTGQCVVALGDRIAGLFGDDATVSDIERIAGRTGELFWHLPIPEESRHSIRTESKVADLLQHNWVRWGSALYAAAFLEAFNGGIPWAHFDIAGPAYNKGTPWGHVPSGGTGFGVATVVEYVSSLAG